MECCSFKKEVSNFQAWGFGFADKSCCIIYNRKVHYHEPSNGITGLALDLWLNIDEKYITLIKKI